MKKDIFHHYNVFHKGYLTIAGSNGDNKLIEIQQNMATTSLKLQESITTGFTDMVTTQSQSTNAMISNTLKKMQKMSTEQNLN